MVEHATNFHDLIQPSAVGFHNIPDTGANTGYAREPK
jgi:hypothetical protein